MKSRELSPLLAPIPAIPYQWRYITNKRQLYPILSQKRLCYSFKKEWYSPLLRPLVNHWNKVICTFLGHGIIIPVGPDKGTCSDCGRWVPEAHIISAQEERDMYLRADMKNHIRESWTWDE